MEGYTLASVIKALLEKGINPSVIIGFGVLLFLVRNGLQLVKDYTTGKDDATKELLGFIRTTQQRQDGREDGFVKATQELAQSLQKLNLSFDAQRTLDDLRYEKLDTRLEKMHRDIWAARGGPGAPSAPTT